MAAIKAEHRGGSIRLRAAVLTSGLIAVALIAVIAFTFYAIRVILLRSGEARAAAAANQIAGIVDAPMPARLTEMRKMVDDASVRELLTTPSPEAESRVASRFKPLFANAALHQTLEFWTAKESASTGSRCHRQEAPCLSPTICLKARVCCPTGW